MLGSRTRAVLLGVVLGAVLAALRAPLGGDPFQVPAVLASTRYGTRAAALFVLAVSIAFARPLFDRKTGPGAYLLLGTTLGFFLWSLCFTTSPTESPVLVAIVGFALAIAAVRAGKLAEPREEDRAEPEVEGRDARTLGECLGLTLAGAGVAIALESIARHSTLLTTQTALDDSVMATVFLIATVIGAVAFGLLCKSAPQRRLATGIGLVCAAALCLVSLSTLSGISDARGFDRYVREYGMFSSWRGHLRYDALLAGTLFTLPAFGLGTAIFCARRRDCTWLVAGGAWGLLAVPSLLARPDLSELTVPSPYSAALVRTATLSTAFGALAFILCTREKLAWWRWLGVVIGVGAGAAALKLPLRPITPTQPWSIRPTFPSLVIDSPAGLLTVEPSGFGVEYLTLDRRFLTPDSDGARADRGRFLASHAMLPKSVRARGELSLLFVGQMTPGRALTLARLGFTKVDRTGAWHESMSAIEQHMFRSGDFENVPGDPLDPETALEKLESGAYDLVLVPPVPGDAPLVDLSDLGSVPTKTTVVCWIDVAGYVAHRDYGAEVVLASDGFSQLSLAVVHAPDRSAMAEGIGFARLGAPLSHPLALSWLKTFEAERPRLALTDFSERLRRANRGHPLEDLTIALAEHYAVQEQSSPWVTDAEATEISPAALRAFRDAGLAHASDDFTRGVIEGLARVLVGKRWIDEVYDYIEPIAKRNAPWPELEKAIAAADIEGLLFHEALLRIDDVAGLLPGDPDVFLLRADAHSGLELHTQAIRDLLRALDLTGEPRKVKSRLAEELVRAFGDEAEAKLGELPEVKGDPELEEMVHALMSGEDAHDH